MIDKIISFSIRQKLFVGVMVSAIIGWGVYSLYHIPIDAVPDITNNQIQVITTSQNLSTQDIEQFITYPVELEMANLPGLVEIRSVSKFGLSVVTVVFEDDMGTYLPRQLIAEKIQTAKENIPDGFGTPEMGPISTGLGEIYQYVVDTKPGYEDKYSAMELRTIQDWVIKRQLSGIEGVVEINTWGGQLKQYEVAINPEKLRSMNISITEVFDALETNNSVTGAGYIEKNKQSYFIRGEGLLGSIKDIQNVVVTNLNNIPVYIRDIAEVQYGYAPRFGAITANAQGEKVMGQVMLLKDANTNEVLQKVIDRIAEIEKNLPEGVYVNAFLERSELIGKTTLTVTENLVLGALIVIFIVMLLLGNWRAGLLIASIIPLSLLFAISLMNYFGISANLMSLGAIDFGIIIDGAIIIVEYVLYAMTQKSETLSKLKGKVLQLENDKIAMQGSGKMMSSAIFGQLIILIVFIPILTLSGIEGKMFKPMAITFSFALIGAMILCLTYVPAMAALFLKPQDQNANSLANKMSSGMENFYAKVFHLVMKFKKGVITAAILFFAGSMYLFTTMGGEFVPTLDEGDLVIQPFIPTGTSLKETMRLSGLIEEKLLEFDEVSQVVSRIGAAEVPTDPMNMEEIDVIIKLKPKPEWVLTKSKEELVELMNERLQVIPGMTFEFTQPIEMRFNELITGVRSDVAIKLYGDDLELLAQKGEEIKKLIKNVDGASDIVLEKTKGLPQMLVKFDRHKVAQYGLNIAELNQIVQMNFSGVAAGVVYEGERRFDLVVRLQENSRQSLEDLKNLFVELPNGNQIPLNEVANINYTYGPAKISRDNTKRRIVVGVNVRDRDMESVVKDIQIILDEKLQLPLGFHLMYGGQFENLEMAKSRLLKAVPIALILIFLLLYLALGTFKDAMLVYTAIPLAATGGIWLLWLRNLPFSISAGIGFIALFGIAVLNGIVLIEHFKELKNRNNLSLRDLILFGTKQRIRPVILTAAAAALGFFPMAISSSAGAEVQRPLATVVIGGLFTSTLLTLVILPLIYYMIENRKRKAMKNVSSVVAFLGFLLVSSSAISQSKMLTVEEAIATALQNNPVMKSATLQVQQYEALKKSAIDFGKTDVSYDYGQINSAQMDYSFEVSQTFKFPTTYANQSQFRNEQITLSQINQQISKSNLERNVRKEYANLVYFNQRLDLYEILDSNYANTVISATRGYELGDIKLLELMTIESSGQKITVDLAQTQIDLQNAANKLKRLLMVDFDITPVAGKFTKEVFQMGDSNVQQNATLNYAKQEVEVAQQAHKVQKSAFAPDLSIGYFNQQIDGVQGMDGVQLGVTVPLFFWEQKGNSQAARINADIAQQQFYSRELQVQSDIETAKLEISKYQLALNYYEDRGLVLSQRLIASSTKSYQAGDIGYIEFMNGLHQGYVIQTEYLLSLRNYNLAVIELNYLLGIYN